jgi:hypothetical protein
MRLPWDDLDQQGCVDHAAPDWNSLTVVGPNKIRDGRGNVTLQWTVTVHCAPALPVTPATLLPAPGAPVLAELDPVEPPPPVGAAA